MWPTRDIAIVHINPIILNVCIIVIADRISLHLDNQGFIKQIKNSLFCETYFVNSGKINIKANVANDNRKKLKPNKKELLKATIPFDTSVMERNNKMITYTRVPTEQNEGEFTTQMKNSKDHMAEASRHYLTSQTTRIGSLKQIRAIKSLPMIDIEPLRWMDEPQRNIGKLESISKSFLSCGSSNCIYDVVVGRFYGRK